VRNHSSTPKKSDSSKDKKKLDVRYYGLLPEDAFGGATRSCRSSCERTLIKQRFLDLQPHVTIADRNTIDTERDLWNRCTAPHEMSRAIPPLFEGTSLRNVLCDGRVMMISVEDFDVVEAAESSSGSSNEQGREFVSNLPDEIRSRLHITVGTMCGSKEDGREVEEDGIRL
jgi:tRNA ligase